VIALSAEGAGWDAWETQHTIGNLCCGLAGQAYALLNLYRHTNEPIWLTRASELTHRAASVVNDAGPGTLAEQLALRPESLYKGELGIIALDSDLNRPEFARMPMFEPEP
jgi:eukaryotic-like serine/threonine-protein kinase